MKLRLAADYSADGRENHGLETEIIEGLEEGVWVTLHSRERIESGVSVSQTIRCPSPWGKGPGEKNWDFKAPAERSFVDAADH